MGKDYKIIAVQALLLNYLLKIVSKSSFEPVEGYYLWGVTTEHYYLVPPTYTTSRYTLKTSLPWPLFI